MYNSYGFTFKYASIILHLNDLILILLKIEIIPIESSSC